MKYDIKPFADLVGAVGMTEVAEAEYFLFRLAPDRYVAGCRDFTLFEALQHWGNRTDERASKFTDALLVEYGAD
jgi:hypothetical protein